MEGNNGRVGQRFWIAGSSQCVNRDKTAQTYQKPQKAGGICFENMDAKLSEPGEETRGNKHFCIFEREIIQIREKERERRGEEWEECECSY